MKSGDIIPVLQTYKTDIPELPGVTNAMSLAETDDAREFEFAWAFTRTSRRP